MSGLVLGALALSLLVVAPLLVPLLRTEAAPAEARRTRTAVLIALALPLAAGGGYAGSGAWRGVLAAQAQAEGAVAEAGIATVAPEAAPSEGASEGPAGNAQAEAMVRRLAQRLKEQPDDVEGWRLLVRSYENLGRFADAEQGYRELERLLPPSAALYTEHAVTLAMSLGQRLGGAPEVLIERALALEPRNAQALALSGSAAYERGDYRRAAALWRQVLEAAGSDQELAASIQESIRKAEALAAGDGARGR